MICFHLKKKEKSNTEQSNLFLPNTPISPGWFTEVFLMIYGLSDLLQVSMHFHLVTDINRSCMVHSGAVFVLRKGCEEQGTRILACGETLKQLSFFSLAKHQLNGDTTALYK